MTVVALARIAVFGEIFGAIPNANGQRADFASYAHAGKPCTAPKERRCAEQEAAEAAYGMTIDDLEKEAGAKDPLTVGDGPAVAWPLAPGWGIGKENCEGYGEAIRRLCLARIPYGVRMAA